jgi:hypothetical protein
VIEHLLDWLTFNVSIFGTHMKNAVMVNFEQAIDPRLTLWPGRCQGKSYLAYQNVFSCNGLLTLIDAKP